MEIEEEHIRCLLFDVDMQAMSWDGGDEEITLGKALIDLKA